MGGCTSPRQPRQENATEAQPCFHNEPPSWGIDVTIWKVDPRRISDARVISGLLGCLCGGRLERECRIPDRSKKGEETTSSPRCFTIRLGYLIKARNCI